MNEKNIELALDLLQAKADTYRESLSEIHWVTENGSSLDGDYCEDCINEAVESARQAISVVGLCYEYKSSCGEYESDYFNVCDYCGCGLDICILPNEKNVSKVIENISADGITDKTAYEAYELIYNAWNDDKHAETDELTEQLIHKVIEKLKEEL